MTETHLNKQILGEYLESNCERQLFLNLGRDDPSWIQPMREVEPLEREKVAALIIQLGEKYEKKVYNSIIQNNKKVIPHPEISSHIQTIALTPDFLERLYQTMKSGDPEDEICLLEFNFPTLEPFIRELLDLNPHEAIPTNFSESLRPDIFIFGNKELDATRFSKVKFKEKEPIRELLPNGTIRKVPEEELKSRIAISIIDVKLSRPETIGKKYFFEILFYFIALNHYLRRHGLDDKFFVRVDGNGIFPGYSDIEDISLTIEEMRKRVVEMPFRDTYILYEIISDKLQEFLDKIPCKIEDIPLNLQPICARCKYLEDCKKTLRYDDSISPEQWDLQLIPYTSKTISEQLKSSVNPQYDTLKDVAENIENYPENKVPTPLYAERPFLKQRAKALIKKKLLTPKTGEHFSIAIPRFNPLTLILDFETDPIHDVVCAVAFHLNSFLTENYLQYDKFVKWWKIWVLNLEDRIEFDELKKRILDQFEYIENEEEQTIQFIRKFSEAIEYMIKVRENMRGNPWLKLDCTSKKGKNYSVIKFNFTLVNKGLTQEDENEFSEEVVSLIYSLVIFLQNLEWFIKENGKFLNSAIFYWSQEQIDYLEEFLERNLDYLNDDPILRKKTLHILRWLNPSESDVKNPLHHKKFYNLRSFAETTMSFPLIINYTWHELASYLSKKAEYRHIFGSELNFFDIYWNPHFNFIDFQQWFRYLYKEGAEKTTLLNEMKNQMIKKVTTLNKLRQVFQRKGKNYLVGYNKPKSMSQFLDYELSEDYHNIAQIWHLFENFTKAYDEFEKDRLRGMYPNYGVGKLESARVNGIWQVPAKSREDFYSYEFELHGMSSNVKIGEGDWVVCVPALLRDLPRYKNHKWIIVIERMFWDTDHWEVTSQTWERNILENYIEELEDSLDYIEDNSSQKIIFNEKITLLKEKYRELQTDGKPVLMDDLFYLYHRASSPWAKKLKDLLSLSHYGESWLGKILAYKWGITKKNILRYPKEFPYEGWLPEIYLYAPNLLPSHKQSPKDLLTKISPKPDSSQKNAILTALQHTVYGIQGPPGTGKTQTIVALIDEFIHRKKEEGTLKILVLAFSYAALRVVFENISTSCNKSGAPTEAANANLVFCRSKERKSPQTHQPIYEVYKKNKKTLVVNRVEGNNKEIIGIVTKDTKEKLEDILITESENMIMFANAHQLVTLNELYYGTFRFLNSPLEFDLIVVDESSQVPVNHILSALQYVRNDSIKIMSTHDDINPNDKIEDIYELDDLYIVSKDGGNRLNPTDLTKLVIVGDQNQLPPVQQVKSPKKLEPILDNLFGYYADHHKVPNDQLQFNYRSHQDIVGFTNFMDIYEHEIKPLINKNKIIDGDFSRLNDWIQKDNSPKIEEWVLEVLDRKIATEALIHHQKYETAVSPLEAHLVVQLVLGYYIINLPNRKKVSLAELKTLQREFWTQKIGVVAPHNAQGRLIVRKLHEILTVHGINDLDERELMELLKKTIYTVEKFQGSARDFIISSIGISAPDQLLNEQEFIYDLNRFNVMTSRARAKFTFICSQNFLTYIPNERELMLTAAKIRRYALDYCQKEDDLTVKFESQKKLIEFRYH
ncbi:MAG: hypothetical protein EU521_00470 [Promethearchaeota archaeon]|nr:MAG: hypothetical protein EU521_00470 [Candidatus Lokiarchaeota archaeon]